MESDATVPTWPRSLIRSLRSRSVAAGYRIAAEYLGNVAAAFQREGEDARAEMWFERALRVRERGFGPEHLDVAASLEDLAWTAKRQRNHGKAAGLLERALRIREQLQGGDHVDVAATLHQLGSVYLDQARYSESELMFRRALQIREQRLGTSHLAVARTLAYLAMLHVRRYAYAAATTMQERSLRIREQALGASHPEVAGAVHYLAGLHHVVGAYAQAEPLYLRALHLREAELGAEHPDVAAWLVSLAGLYRDRSASAQAKPLYQRALRIREHAQGRDHPEVAPVLDELGRLSIDEGDDARARLLFERALWIRETKLGPDHGDVAISLSNLAGLRRSQGVGLRAVPLLERALRIRETAFGPDDPRVAEALRNLGMLCGDQGDHVRAAQLLERAVQIHERARGADHGDVARALNDLALLHRNRGAYSQAAPLFERASQIYEATIELAHPTEPHASAQTEAIDEHASRTREPLALEDPTTEGSLFGLAELHRQHGSFAQARSLYERLLAISERARGSDHLFVATVVHKLGSTAEALGAHAEAEVHFRRAADISERSLGPDHPRVVDALMGLAGAYLSRGADVEAEPIVERALRIREQTFGPGHPEVARSLTYLATLYRDQGAYQLAMPLAQRALSIYEHAHGPAHPDVAYTLSLIAGIHVRMGARSQARPLYERALSLRESALGPDHVDVASSLDTVASVLKDQDEYERAEALLERALDIRTRRLGPDHVETADLLNNLAMLHQDQGAHTRAVPLFERALQICEHALGAEHPRVAVAMNNLAMLRWFMGDVPGAIDSFVREAAVRESSIVPALAALPEPRKRMLLDQERVYADLFVSFHAHAAPDRDDALRLAMTTTLRRKGRVLEEVTIDQAALRRDVAVELHGELRSLQERQRELATRRRANDEARHGDVLHELAEEVARRQRELSRKSAGFRARTKPVAIEAVQAAIPRDAVLAEFALYERFEPTGKTSLGWKEARYIAYLLRHEGPPGWVDLGAADEIDAAVARARAALARIDHNARDALRTLDALVFAPIRHRVKGAEHFLLSLDGALHLVPFAALIDEAGHHLVENFLITYLTSGRDVVRWADRSAPGSAPLIVAAPDYQGRCEPLRGAEAEANALLRMFADAEVCLGADATKDRLTAVRGPRFLHVACHGFFRAPATSQRAPDARWRSADRDVEAASLLPSPRPAVDLEDALDNAGLLLAGPDEVAATLTAREIAAMDLRGTRLVVLSACDTGIGEVARSEGVYGLRRALTIAGAQTQVVSLWKVDDAATSELMSLYYGELCRGAGRSDALRRAQLAQLRGPRASPYFWAAFVAIGDERPL